MKKSFIVMVLSILVLTVCGGSAWAEGNLNILLGQKNLDSSDWEPAENQSEIGLIIDFKGQDWPISIAIDLLSSKDEETVGGIELEGKTQEVNIGVRKYWQVTNVFKPYVGGGLANINGEVSGSFGGFSVSADDSALGFWVGGGVCFTLAKHFNVGADLRFSKAEININGIDGEAGGLHFLVFAGFHF